MRIAVVYRPDLSFAGNTIPQIRPLPAVTFSNCRSLRGWMRIHARRNRPYAAPITRPVQGNADSAEGEVCGGDDDTGPDRFIRVKARVDPAPGPARTAPTAPAAPGRLGRCSPPSSVRRHGPASRGRRRSRWPAVRASGPRTPGRRAPPRPPVAPHPALPRTAEPSRSRISEPELTEPPRPSQQRRR